MRRQSIYIYALTFAGAMTLAPAAAAVADELPVAVRACTAEKNDARRLSCYDREIARSTQRGAPAVSSAAPDAIAPEQKFGYRGDVARAELDRRAAADARVERIKATITEISSQVHGELVVTLDNDQVWAQKSADLKIRLKVGDAIAIKKASLGSFLLVSPTGATTRVSRVR